MACLRWLNKNFEEVFCGILLIGIMFMLMGQVLTRFLFGYGLTFSEELSRYFFLYFVYFCSSLVAAKGLHIRVTAQMLKMPARLKTAMLFLADLLWLTFNGVLVWQGTLLFISMGRRSMVAGSLQIDLRWVYVAVPVAFALQSFRIIQRWVAWRRRGAPILGGEIPEEG